MPKQVLIGLLTAIGGLAGGLLGNLIEEQGKKPNSIFNKYGVIGAIVILIISLVISAWLETETRLQANWRWHRRKYLKRLKRHLLALEGQTNFGRLDLQQRERIALPQIAGDNGRQNMVETLLDLIRDNKNPACKVLVLGEPGSGKTTGIERLTYQLAVDAEKKLGFGGRIPVLARLNDYSQGSLLDFAGEKLKDSTGKNGEVLGKGLKKLIEKDQVILLLDSVDEALGDRRDAVRTQLKELVESESYRSLPVVITGRTREDPSSGLDQLQVFEIQDLDDNAVKTFIKAYKPPDADEGKIWAQLESYNLLKDKGLGKNPFWLSLIVKNNIFNRNKGLLLNEAVDGLFKREWDEKRENKHQWERVLARDLQLEGTKSALGWLAYKMSDTGVLTIESGEASQILNAWLGSKDWFSGLTSHDVVMLGQHAQVLHYKVQRRIESQPLQFRHRLLQEFLTAWAIHELKTPVPDVLEQFSASDQYWETLILLGGITKDRGALIDAALGNGSDCRRILLAIALLHSHSDINESLRTKLVSAFVKALEAGVTDELKKAARQLSLIIGDSVVDAIGQLLNSGVAVNIKLGLIEILTALSGDKVIGYLIPLVDDVDLMQPVNNAFVAIGEPAIKPLITSLRDRSVKARPPVMKALIAIGTPAVPALMEELRTPDLNFRGAVVQVLGRIGDARAISPLMLQLSPYTFNKIPVEHLQWRTRELSDPQPPTEFQRPGIPIKRRLLALEFAKKTREARNEQRALYWESIHALARLGAPAVPNLIESLSRTEPLVAAPLILAMIGHPAVDALIRTLAHNDVEIRNLVIEILAAIGFPARPALQKAAGDEEPNIWVGAAQALRIIESATEEEDEAVDPHVRKFDVRPQTSTWVESQWHNEAPFRARFLAGIDGSRREFLTELKNNPGISSFGLPIQQLCMQHLAYLEDENARKRMQAIEFFARIRSICRVETNGMRQVYERTKVREFFAPLSHVASQAIRLGTIDSNSAVRTLANDELSINNPLFDFSFTPVLTLLPDTKDNEPSEMSTGIPLSTPEEELHDIERTKEKIIKTIEQWRDSG